MNTLQQLIDIIGETLACVDQTRQGPGLLGS